MIAQPRPRFRTDLVAQPIDEGGERFVDVTDPDSGNTFRFYEVEYSIACAMNGQRDVSGLAIWAQMELGLQPSPDELQTVINTLAELGYLDNWSTPPSLDDLTLGHAGNNPPEDDDMPSVPDMELGTAGNEDAGGNDEATFVAPSLSLGHAGNERVATMQPPERRPEGKEQSFAGLMDDDEDQVPTTIKRPGQVTGSRDAVEPALLPVGGTPDADDDGPTNLPPPAPDFDDEMSVDLSDHLHLGPDAVKEAVRQSQLMQAVEVDDGAGQQRASTAPPPMPAPPAAPADASPTAGAGKPVELSDKRAQVSKPVEPVIDREPTGETSRVGLLVLVLLLVLVAGAAAVYALNLFDIRAKLGLDTSGETASQDPQVQQPVAEPEKKPELPSATLMLGEAPVVEFKATDKGRLATIVAAGAVVKQGDVVAKLDDTAAIDKKIAEYRSRQAVYQARLDSILAKKAEAEKAGNAAAAKRYESEAERHQKKVDEKRILADDEEKKLEPFMLTAPAEGAVETALKEGDSFQAEDVLFSIKGTPPLQATFTIKGHQYAQDAEVEIVAKADETKRLDCKVIKVEGESVTIECPGDGGLSADNVVILRP